MYSMWTLSSIVTNISDFMLDQINLVISKMSNERFFDTDILLSLLKYMVICPIRFDDSLLHHDISTRFSAGRM